MSNSAMDWLDDNSSGNRYPGVYFANVGDFVAGEILDKPRVVTTTNDKGEREDKLVIEVKARSGCTARKGSRRDNSPIEEGDNVSIWVKAGFLASAVREAVKAAGARGLAEGDTIVVQHSGLKDTGKMEPAKEFSAKYVVAKPAVSVEAIVPDVSAPAAAPTAIPSIDSLA